MQVEFNATLDELADVTTRTLQRSPSAKQARWSATVVCGFFAGMFAYLVTPAEVDGKLIAATVGCLIGMAVHHLPYERRLAQNLRRHAQEMLGSDAPLRVVVDLSSDGIRFKQHNTETTHKWSDITDILEENDAIYFHYKPMGVCAVRNRGFPHENARTRFLDLAKKYMEQARIPE